MLRVRKSEDHCEKTMRFGNDRDTMLSIPVVNTNSRNAHILEQEIANEVKLSRWTTRTHFACRRLVQLLFQAVLVRFLLKP
jgi:hypothetical protein